MRVISAVFCAFMILFAAVQYNDPDALYWGSIYGISAIWCGIAALRPAVFERPVWRGLLGLCCVLAAAGVAWHWPHTPGWWQKEVWWNTETAREGMGMMIALAALGIAWFASRSVRVRT